MQHKILLLASFVDKNYVHKFLYRLKDRHKVDTDKVFIFDLSEDDFLLTYKLKIEPGVRFNIREELPKTIQVHKKQKTFFTINALNKLIERDSGLSDGNVNHKQHKVDWDKYSDKLVLLKKDVLEISDIKRVFLPDS